VTPEIREYNAEITMSSVTIAVEGIRIISDKNVEDSDELNKAKLLIKNAERIAILGFGYHRLSMQRLGFPLNGGVAKQCHGTCKSIYPPMKNKLSKAFGVNLDYETIDDFLNHNPHFYDD
jgi:hypothetical protein